MNENTKYYAIRELRYSALTLLFIFSNIGILQFCVIFMTWIFLFAVFAVLQANKWHELIEEGAEKFRQKGDYKDVPHLLYQTLGIIEIVAMMYVGWTYTAAACIFKKALIQVYFREIEKKLSE